ncbi:MAG: NUDIX domain-containing protein [Candidatus Nucleicultricaceae bacterium]
MGTEKLYYLGVKAFIQNKAGAVLLLKVNTSTFKNHKDGDYWDIPGGRVMGGEDVLETLHREVKEETGIHTITTPKSLGFVLSTIEIPLRGGDDSVGLILSLYSCMCDKSVTVTLSSEHTGFAWVTLDEALERLMYKYPKDLLDLARPLRSMYEDPQ